MPTYAIGDGNKTIVCPNGYLADSEDNETIMLWRANDSGFVIRCSVISVSFKDGTPVDSMRANNRRDAAKRGVSAHETEEITYHYSRPVVSNHGPTESIQYFYAAYRNHAALISITLPTDNIDSPAHAETVRDVCGMIETFCERKPDGMQFSDLLISDQKKIAAAVAQIDGELKVGGKPTSEIESLQHLLEADRPDRTDLTHAESVGLKFGELVKSQVPPFNWQVVHDPYGRGLGLRFGNSGVASFPADMIIKRVERGEAFSVAELFEGMLDSVEGLFKKHG